MESVPGKVRIGATGLKKGWGASAFYYKHKIENRRGSWMLLPPASLIFAVVLIGFSFFMRESGILPVFAFAVYLQLFTAGQSRINRELYKPFIYLVPESSFSKLLHCLRELVPSALAEAIVVFVPVGLILGMGPGAILVCLFARMSYALLFQSGNLLLERFWSGASKALIMFLYFLILILLTLPGILIAVFLMVLLNLPGGVSGGLLVAGIINIPVALLLLYLLRDMLAVRRIQPLTPLSSGSAFSGPEAFSCSVPKTIVKWRILERRSLRWNIPLTKWPICWMRWPRLFHLCSLNN